MSIIKWIRVPDVFFFGIPFISGLIYLFAFYPGISSYDSIYQWDEVSRFAFSNWHPAYHTILIWLFTRIWYSPAVMALLQITVFSMVIAYGLRAFLDLGVPLVLLFLLGGLISIVPLNGMMVVTLWKDVLYSISVLLFTIYLLKIVMTKGAWITSGWNWGYLALTAANITLLRHNGFPVAFGVLFAILLVFNRRIFTFLSLVVSLILVVITIGPVYTLFKVNRSNTQPMGVVFIHPIAAYIKAGAVFSDEEKTFLNGIRPLKDGWPYSCYDATVLFYQGIDFTPVAEDPWYAAKLLGRLMLRSPRIAIKHFACLSSFVWQPSQPKNILLEIVYSENQDLGTLPQWQPYARFVDQRPKLPWVKKTIVLLLDAYARFDPGMVAWRPAIYLDGYMISIGFFAFRKKNPLVALLLVPPMLQSLVIAVTAQLQAVRYQYPVYLIAMLFTIPVFYLAIKQDQK